MKDGFEKSRRTPSSLCIIYLRIYEDEAILYLALYSFLRSLSYILDLESVIVITLVKLICFLIQIKDYFILLPEILIFFKWYLYLLVLSSWTDPYSSISPWIFPPKYRTRTNSWCKPGWLILRSHALPPSGYAWCRSIVNCSKRWPKRL